MSEPGYLCDSDGEPFNAETFSLENYLAEAVPDERLLEYPEGRRVLTRLDPLLFGLVYCRDLLKDDEGRISFADLHLDLCRMALEWLKRPQSRESRNAFVAPRGLGKSTWAFKILPIWAAAHQHLEFVAAFSSSASQAQTHLSGFKRQLDTNPRLREDFPDLCHPAKRPSGNNVADSQEMYFAKNKFSFAARGLDSEVLGLVDPLNRRPDGILLDDIEPDESNYSPYLKRKRLSTVIDTIFPMNERAHVTLIGTVTMPESIIHDLVKTKMTDDKPPRWITDERFKVHYLRPIVAKDDGSERSIWPGNPKWSIDYLQSIRHTHSFKKNLDNQPVGVDGQYWTESDFRYGDITATRVLLQIDPAVTSKRNSDYSALAVVAYEPGATATDKGVEYFPRCAVRHIEGVRLPPAKLRDRVLRILERFPEIGGVRIEVNQGGETWKSVFHDLPVQLVVHTESIPKKTRAEHLLNHYQRERVYHVKNFPHLEEQMVSFPHVLNDDLIDAVGAAVQYFLAPKPKARGRTLRYAGM